MVLTMFVMLVQHPGSITQTDAADIETDGVDSDDDNDVLKSDQVRLSSRDIFPRVHLPNHHATELFTLEACTGSKFIVMHNVRSAVSGYLVTLPNRVAHPTVRVAQAQGIWPRRSCLAAECVHPSRFGAAWCMNCRYSSPHSSQACNNLQSSMQPAVK